jgi:3',5'-cyclic AMP phosphodiesterase CpdA
MTTRLFHISDVHFGVEDRSALAAVESAIAEERPDALICTGDLTQRAKHSEYAAAAEWFSAFDLPVVLEPGNHDMPYYNLIERFTDPYRRFRKLAAGVGSRFESDDVVLVSLISTVRAQPRFPWSDGFVRRRPLDRTVAALERLAEDRRTRLVTCHHPLLGPKTAATNPTIGGDAAFTAVANAGAHAILSGHVHVPFDEVRTIAEASTRMIGAGTLSTRLRGGAPPSYRVITCEAGGKIDSELRVLG